MKSFLFVAFLTFSLYPILTVEQSNAVYLPDVSIQEGLQANALKVLATKCNSCHATKKRQDIFTIENMNALAADINRQVFIKKKMPKGRKNKLSEKEITTLKMWLDLVLKNDS